MLVFLYILKVGIFYRF